MTMITTIAMITNNEKNNNNGRETREEGSRNNLFLIRKPIYFDPLETAAPVIAGVNDRLSTGRWILSRSQSESFTTPS